MWQVKERGLCASAHSEPPPPGLPGPTTAPPTTGHHFIPPPPRPPRTRPRPAAADIEDLARVDAVWNLLVLLARGHWPLPRALVDEGVSVLEEAAPHPAAAHHRGTAAGNCRRALPLLRCISGEREGGVAWRGDGVTRGTPGPAGMPPAVWVGRLPPRALYADPRKCRALQQRHRKGTTVCEPGGFLAAQAKAGALKTRLEIEPGVPSSITSSERPAP